MAVSAAVEQLRCAAFKAAVRETSASTDEKVSTEKLREIVTSIVQKPLQELAVSVEKKADVEKLEEVKVAMEQKVGMDRLQELQSSVEQEARSAAAKAVFEQMSEYKEAQVSAMRTRHDELQASVTEANAAQVNEVKLALEQKVSVDELRKIQGAIETAHMQSFMVVSAAVEQ